MRTTIIESGWWTPPPAPADGVGRKGFLHHRNRTRRGIYTLEVTTYNPNEAGTFTLTVSGLGSGQES